MAAELVAHRREKLVCKIRFASRTEPLVQRTRENRHQRSFVNRGFYRPTPFAGAGNPTG
jgi:hypothetical protein